MANGLDVKERNLRDIPDNDPLMELSRIMGFGQAEPEPGRTDPQIAAEDSFSMDLERELQVEEIPAGDSSFDANFTAEFEDRLSDVLRIEADAPSVVPTLEDELGQLLENEAFEATAVSTPDAALSNRVDIDPLDEQIDDIRFDFESDVTDPDLTASATTAWAREPLETGADHAFPWPEVARDDALESELEEDGALEAQVSFDSLYATEPEVEAENASYRPDTVVAESLGETSVHSAVYEQQIESDLVDEQLDYTGYEEFGAEEPVVTASAEPVSGDSEYEPEDGFDAFRDLAALDIPPAPEFGEVAPAPVSYAGNSEAFPEGDDFARFDEDTLAPLVEASEPRHDEVTQTEDFEIPDFDFQSLSDVPPPASAYDEFEDQIEVPAPAPIHAQNTVKNGFDDADFDFDTLISEELAVAATAGAAAATLRSKPVVHVDADHEPDPFQRTAIADDVFAPVAVQTAVRRPWLLPAAVAGALLLFGGGLYYAFSGDGAAVNADGPALVKADPEPVKVAPENPGGSTVANQDKAVYDKVEGDQAALPAQGALVSESEEPVDIAAVTPAAQPEVPETAVDTATVKAEDRVETPAVAETSAPAAETAAVTPKKVRTVIVKPDGTLVERPVEAAPVAETAAETPANDSVPVASVAPVETAPVTPAADVPAAAEKTATVATEPAAPAEDPIAQIAAAEPEAPKVAPAAPEVPEAKAETPAAEPAIKVVKAKKIKPKAVEESAAAAETVPVPADAAPILERPADQPVNIVGQTGGQQAAAETQVASAEPAPASGGYSIQIASTPSPEAAKSTYAALSRKFGGVIGGKGVNIQKANVEGKGTVYRVRIPAGSKQNAAALCSDYKAAGGNCFVTK